MATLMTTKSETQVQQDVKLEASQRGMRLWRNNNGAFHDGQRMVRYGLANESSAVSKGCKSADLIGCTPYAVTADDAGFTQMTDGTWARTKEPRIIGIFTSIECKRGDWNGSTTGKREQAQDNWRRLVLSLGGFAMFAKDVREVWPEPLAPAEGAPGK